MTSTMTKLVAAFAFVLAGQHAQANDAFDVVKCSADVGAALLGKHLDNGAVAAIEKKHSALGLKHEGSDDVSDALSYENWTICGGSYHFLVKGDVIRSVVRADHSRNAPAFLGRCKLDGAPTSYAVFAVLKAPDSGHASAGESSLPAQNAWRIDEAKAQFVPMSAAGLVCPRDGISTADGGP